MTFDPGRVRIALYSEHGAVSRTEISCERPALARLLNGRDAAQAVALVPLVYSLCGQAQGIAARAALAAARGAARATDVDAAVLAEAAREHAWKLFVDWPGQLGLAPDEAFFVRLMRTVPEQRAELSEALDAHVLTARLAATAGHGPMAELFARRLKARLTELGDWLRNRTGMLGTVSASCPAPGSGEATVETARGPLVHRLVLEGDRIADYRIVAPTDLRFAPGGEAAASLAQLCGMSIQAAEREVKLLALALDPCVPWECSVIEIGLASPRGSSR